MALSFGERWRQCATGLTSGATRSGARRFLGADESTDFTYTGVSPRVWR